MKIALSILDQQAEQSSPATSDAASCSSTNASLNRQADPEGTPERGRGLAAAVVDWQPIDTAPDGQRVWTIKKVAMSEGYFEPQVLYRNGDYWFFEPGNRHGKPDFWQPYNPPSPPNIFKSSAQRGGE